MELTELEERYNRDRDSLLEEHREKLNSKQLNSFTRGQRQRIKRL